LVVGGVFSAIGLSSLFISVGTADQPHYFWCFYIGGPVIAIGFALLSYGCMGEATQHSAPRAPLTDWLDHDEGTTASPPSSTGTGTDAATPAVGTTSILCPQCGHTNHDAAKFCETCGTPLENAKACPKCHALSGPDALYCHHCGHEFAS